MTRAARTRLSRDGSASASASSTRSGARNTAQSGFFAPGVGVFIYPLAFLAACALLIMHVQVSGAGTDRGGGGGGCCRVLCSASAGRGS